MPPRKSARREPRDMNVVEHASRRVFDRFFKIDEKVLSYDRIDGPGRIERRRWLVFERGDAAAVLIHDIENDAILLTEQLRAATLAKGPGVIREIVAGMIEPGETPQQCIRREIEEEIGYTLRKRDLRPIAHFYVSPGGSSERIFLFYARVRPSQRTRDDARGLAVEGEDIATLVVPRARFLAMATGGELDDAKTLVAGLWLAAQPAAMSP
jgi:ADP-ribose pyrophosphatase